MSTFTPENDFFSNSSGDSTPSDSSFTFNIFRKKSPVLIREIESPFSLYLQLYKITPQQIRKRARGFKAPERFVLRAKITYLCYFCLDNTIEQILRTQVNTVFVILLCIEVPHIGNSLLQLTQEDYLHELYSPLHHLLIQSRFSTQSGTGLPEYLETSVKDEIFEEVSQYFFRPFEKMALREKERQVDAIDQVDDKGIPVPNKRLHKPLPYLLDHWETQADTLESVGNLRNQLHRDEHARVNFGFQQNKKNSTRFIDVFKNYLNYDVDTVKENTFLSQEDTNIAAPHLIKRFKELNEFTNQFDFDIDDSYDEEIDEYEYSDEETDTGTFDINNSSAKETDEYGYVDDETDDEADDAADDEADDATDDEADDEADEYGYVDDETGDETDDESDQYESPFCTENPVYDYERPEGDPEGEKFSVEDELEVESLIKNALKPRRPRLQWKKEEREDMVEPHVWHQRDMKAKEKDLNDTALASLSPNERKVIRAERKKRESEKTKYVEFSPLEELLNSSYRSGIYLNPYDSKWETIIRQFVVNVLHELPNTKNIRRSQIDNIVHALQRECVLSLVAGMPEIFEDNFNLEDTQIREQLLEGQIALPPVPLDQDDSSWEIFPKNHESSEGNQEFQAEFYRMKSKPARPQSERVHGLLQYDYQNDPAYEERLRYLNDHERSPMNELEKVYSGVDNIMGEMEGELTKGVGFASANYEPFRDSPKDVMLGDDYEYEDVDELDKDEETEFDDYDYEYEDVDELDKDEETEFDEDENENFGFPEDEDTEFGEDEDEDEILDDTNSERLNKDDGEIHQHNPLLRYADGLIRVERPTMGFDEDLWTGSQIDFMTQDLISGMTKAYTQSTIGSPNASTGHLNPLWGTLNTWAPVHWGGCIAYTFCIYYYRKGGLNPNQYFYRPTLSGKKKKKYLWPVRHLPAYRNPHRIRRFGAPTPEISRALQQMRHWIVTYPIRKIYILGHRFRTLRHYLITIIFYKYKVKLKYVPTDIAIHWADTWDIIRWWPVWVLADIYGAFAKICLLNVRNMWYLGTHAHTVRPNDQNMFLFVGSHASGKTFLAKTIAGDCNVDIYALDAMDIIYRPKRDKGEVEDPMNPWKGRHVTKRSLYELNRFLHKGKNFITTSILLFENADKLYVWKYIRDTGGKDLWNFYMEFLFGKHKEAPMHLLIHTTESVKHFPTRDLADNLFGTTVLLTLPSLQGRIQIIEMYFNDVFKPGYDWTLQANLLGKMIPRVHSGFVANLASRARGKFAIKYHQGEPRDTLQDEKPPIDEINEAIAAQIEDLNSIAKSPEERIKYKPKRQKRTNSYISTDTGNEYTLLAHMFGNAYLFWSRRRLLTYTHGFASGESLAGQQYYRYSLRPSKIISEGIRDVPDMTEAENIWKRSKIGSLEKEDIDRIIPSSPWLFDDPTYTPDPTLLTRKIYEDPIYWKPTTPEDYVAPWIIPE